MTTARSSARKIFWLYLISALVSLIGLGDAIYLTVQDLTGESLRCTIISGCSEVLSSKYAHVGPVPLATIGAIAYFVVFSLAVLATFGYGFARPLILIIVILMFLATLWLLYLQAFVIRHFCQYCLLSAAVTTALAVLTIIASRTKTHVTSA
ncbi:MAG TPA: vitamin K epoxide reductase family protein [Pyrinomonadaceae bacterium]|nr:vitamin K epoxide reductase family protein [Pyrinomonadaceae bacterium]